MSCLGVHFALTEEQANEILGLNSDTERREHVVENIEENLLGTPYAAESDKAWDAIHRALSDGYLTWDGGQYPLNHTILAGRLLYSSDDYIMSLKDPTQVKDISAATKKIDEPSLRALYGRIPAEDYDADLGDEDFKYTWSWFEEVANLYETAAKEGRYVLFTADQ